MNPGATTKPFASIVIRPVSGFGVTVLTLPAFTPTLRAESSFDSGSITLPLRMTRSKSSTTTGVAPLLNPATTAIERQINGRPIARRLVTGLNNVVRFAFPVPIFAPPKKCGAGFQPAHSRRVGQVGNLPHTFSSFQGEFCELVIDSSENQPRRNEENEEKTEQTFVLFVSSC